MRIIQLMDKIKQENRITARALRFGGWLSARKAVEAKQNKTKQKEYLMILNVTTINIY